MTPTYLTRAQLAEAFQVSASTAYRWLRYSDIPKVCINPGAKVKYYRYSVAEVAAWLRCREMDEKGGQA